MLRDAALLQLDLLLDALDEGMVLKDGTAFNVQWVGSRPTFIDISSFTALRPGEPWAGYRQFCAQCLNPLLLQAYKGVPFGPWLRGSLDGIEPGVLAGLFSLRDLARPGVFTHVYMHAKMQQRYGDSRSDVRRSLKEAGLDASVIKSTVRGLRRVVDQVSSREAPSPWADYAKHNSYEEEDRARKRAFVDRVVGDRRRALVWDIGANTGEYSRLAAANADYVLAFDADHGAVERHYRAVREEGRSNILPLVVNVLNPTPDMGWRLAERKSLAERGRPDLVLCLALAHHLVLGSNVPVPELLAYLADLSNEAVVEFIDRADPMARQLLRHRDGLFADYTRERFEAQLSQAFRIERREPLAGDRRVLYYVTREPQAAGRRGQ
jgi:hypothetical protein